MRPPNHLLCYAGLEYAVIGRQQMNESNLVQKHHQRFIAYALVGYLEVARRTGSGDYDFNNVIGNLAVWRRLKEHGADEVLVEFGEQVDQMESVLDLCGLEAFGRAMDEAISPLLPYMRAKMSVDGDALCAVDELLAASLRGLQ